jgi:TolB-like protein/class 3 adenylate cyclase/Flp pilus assembly protein TadD
MPAEAKGVLRLEIGHVLFIDIVGYSTLLISEQSELLSELNDVVRATEQFRSAEAQGKLVRLPTGDGMALVFHNSPEEPVRCALEISRILKEHPKLRVRMGIHSGPVNEVADVNERANIAGAGINIAQRVMDCGDAGHILLSKHVAEDLQHYPEWRPNLHDVGQCEVKHGEIISIVNLYTDEVGNPQPPRLKRAETQMRRRRRRNALVIGVAGLIALIIAGFFLLPRASARKIDRSIAVLPFQNLSDEKENAYFADGIQDDVLTNLSKISDLKVISHTSVMQYRGKAPNAREIGKALGVSTLLEGSVRRSGNRVRVNVQLINTENDQHIWAEDYDRDLTDVFAIQSDLAEKIASALQAKLSPNEKSQINRRPTENNDAYLAFIQGEELFYRPDKFRSDSLQAERLLEQATKLDPQFADAFALLGSVENWIYHSSDPIPARAEKARAAISRALELQPDLAWAHLAQGFYYYYIDRDYERALEEFAIAQRGLPNSSDIYLARGSIERRQGKWTQSTANLEKAASLDPKNAWILQNLADNYVATKKYELADKTLDRAIEVAPQTFAARGLKAKLAIDRNGDTTVAEKLLAQVPPGFDPEGLITLSRVHLLMLQRKFSEALPIVQRWPGDLLSGEGTAPKPKAALEGGLYFFQGDKVRAQAAFERARPLAEQSLRESPSDSARHLELAFILVGLDRKEEAIAEGKRAVDLTPESADAFSGPEFTASLAQIYALTGETDQALNILERSLHTPNGITVPILKLDPLWDSLRSDSRFQALIGSSAKN